MSLINDALKKRREAEDLQPPPLRGDLELQPVEGNAAPGAAEQVVSRARWFWLIAVIAVVILNLCLFFWYAQRKAIQARARAVEAAARVEQAAAEAEAERLRLAAEQAAASNAALAQAEQDRIQRARPGFRLQGIVFHPTRPSAIINNRAVSVGERVAGYKVTAISRNQATLATDRDEVTLTLP